MIETDHFERDSTETLCSVLSSIVDNFLFVLLANWFIPTQAIWSCQDGIWPPLPGSFEVKLLVLYSGTLKAQIISFTRCLELYVFFHTHRLPSQAFISGRLVIYVLRLKAARRTGAVPPSSPWGTVFRFLHVWLGAGHLLVLSFAPLL